MLEMLLQPGETDERCGLVLIDDSIVEIENVAEDKTNSYKMNAAGVLPFIDKGLVKGTWHTHPATDPNLSGEDRRGFLAWPDLEHSIIGIRDKVVTVVTYRVDNGIVITCD